MNDVLKQLKKSFGTQNFLSNRLDRSTESNNLNCLISDQTFNEKSISNPFV